MSYVYSEVGRLYSESINGEMHYLPGVTTILSATEEEEKKILFAVLRKQRPGYDVYARKIGSEVHALIDQYLKQRVSIDSFMTDDTISTVAKETFLSIKPFLDDLECISSERRFFAPKLGYAGTIDLIAKYQGVNVVVDWKTSQSLKDPDIWYDYPLQAAAYVKAANECFHDGLVLTSPIQRAIIVRMTPEEQPQFYIMGAKEIKEAYLKFYERLKEFYIYKLGD